MGAATSDFLGLEELLFPVPALSYDGRDERLLWFSTAAGGRIPAFLTRRQDQHASATSSSSGSRSMMIYFHANACDIGHAALEAEYITYYTGMEVLLPEYPGYGLLDSYRSTIGGVNGVASAALQFVTKNLEIPPSRVVLFGRSLGTGPACAMARESHKMGLPVGSVILVAPFLSLKKLVAAHAPLAQDMIDDHWDNQSALETCGETSLLIIHGQNDRVIPYEHGRALYACAATQQKIGFFPNWLSHNQWKCEESFAIVKKFLQKRNGNHEVLVDGGVERAFSNECPGGENLVLDDQGLFTARGAREQVMPKSSQSSSTATRNEGLQRVEEYAVGQAQDALDHMFYQAAFENDGPEGKLLSESLRAAKKHVRRKDAQAEAEYAWNKWQESKSRKAKDCLLTPVVDEHNGLQMNRGWLRTPKQ